MRDWWMSAIVGSEFVNASTRYDRCDLNLCTPIVHCVWNGNSTVDYGNGCLCEQCFWSVFRRQCCQSWGKRFFAARENINVWSYAKHVRSRARIALLLPVLSECAPLFSFGKFPVVLRSCETRSYFVWKIIHIELTLQDRYGWTGGWILY